MEICKSKYEQQKYYLWLQNVLGVGYNLSRVFSVFESPEEVYESSSNDLKLSGVFDMSAVNRITEGKELAFSKALEIIQECEKDDINILTPNMREYPARLLEIPDFPAALFVQGDKDLLSWPLSVSIVGTRKPLSGAVVATEALSRALSSAGFSVVSGGALGIDTAAHVGALCGSGKTVLVLGCGIGSDYLSAQKPLRKAVAENGALVSELPPRTAPVKYTFPKRNRIIAALSLGTIVMDAGIKSGSLITAKAAMSYNKDVFATSPFEVGSTNEGCKELLKDGAIKVSSAMDVVKEYLSAYAEYIEIENSVDLTLDISKMNRREYLVDAGAGIERYKRELASGVVPRMNRTEKVHKDMSGLSQDAKDVLSAFSGKPLSVNELVSMNNYPMGTLLGILTELQISGYLEMLPNAKYIVK